MIHRIEAEKRYLKAISVLDENKSVAHITINDVIRYVNEVEDKLHRRNMQIKDLKIEVKEYQASVIHYESRIKDYKSRIVNAEDYQNNR